MLQGLIRPRMIIEYLQVRFREIIIPEEWPPMNLDLNTLNCSIWFIVEQIIHCELITDVKDLKKSVLWRKSNNR